MELEPVVKHKVFRSGFKGRDSMGVMPEVNGAAEITQIKDFGEIDKPTG